MVVSKCPSFDSLSFEDAVRLFSRWGFQVEPGPRPDQVTLITREPDCRTYCVCPADQLTELAATALRVRYSNGALSTPALDTVPVCDREGKGL